MWGTEPDSVRVAGWKRRTGSLKARECREFLEKLQSQGGLVLPAKRPGRPAGKATEVPVTARGEPGARLVGTADLGEIRLSEAGAATAVPGAGGALPLSGPPGAVRGASALSGLRFGAGGHGGGLRAVFERGRCGLVHVVSNSRYLVLPWVQVKNLASRILSRAVRQLAVDWPRSYGVEVFLVETLVDPGRYRGSCYRGANWIELGSTRGGKREDRLAQSEAVRPKRVLVYPLVAEAARRLREG